MKIRKKPSASPKKAAKIQSGRGLLTLDITDQSVKAACFTGRSSEQLVLENYRIFPLPQGCVQDGKIAHEEQFVAVLQQIQSSLGEGTKNFVLALPHPMVTIQSFYYATDDETSLDDAANFEAAQIATIDDINLDYQVIGGSEDSGEVVMAIALKSDTTPYLDCLTESGLGDPKLLDVETYAVVNAFSNWINTQSPSLESETLAVFDIGGLRTQCLVMKAGKILFKQEIMFGGEQLTRDLQRLYQLDNSAAESIKTSSEQPADYQEAAVNGFNQELALEINRVLQFYYTSAHSSNSSKIGKIVLTGGSSVLEHLSETVAEQCDISTIVVNPIQHLGIAGHIDPATLMQDAGRLTVCCGLAVRGVL